MPRKLARVLLNVLTALSLVLCVTAFVLWERGDSTLDQQEYASYWFDGQRHRYRAWGAFSFRDRLVFFRGDGESTPAPESRQEFVDRFGQEPNGWRFQSMRIPDDSVAFKRDRWWNVLGFEYSDDHHGLPGSLLTQRVRRVVCPMALPTFLASILPAVRLIALTNRLQKARAAAAAGHCPKCGYDLRATPGRCPECGTAAPSSGRAERT